MAYYLPWLSNTSGDPFPWFTAFNMNDFLPHSQSGVWGPQRPILPPAAPVITSTGTAGNASQLATALYTGGVQVTLTANIPSTTFNASNIIDSTVIVPPGIKWIDPVIGAGGAGITVTRMLVRGNTLGVRSGGQLNNFNFIPLGSDCVIDGLDVYGRVNHACLALGPSATFNKMAVVNCQLNAQGFGIGSTCGNLTVAGCSIMTGNDLAFPPTDDEAYAIRAYFESLANVVVAHCELRSNPGRATFSHARLRSHPTPGLDYVALIKSRLVDRVENWMGWIDASGGGGSGVARATWWQDSQFISGGSGTDPGAGVPKLYGHTPPDVDYAYVYRNAFDSNAFLSNADIFLAGNVVTDKSSNTFTGSLSGSDPAWSAALFNGAIPGCGDPTGIVA